MNIFKKNNVREFIIYTFYDYSFIYAPNELIIKTTTTTPIAYLIFQDTLLTDNLSNQLRFGGLDDCECQAIGNVSL